jgi:hypothetical protein
MRKILSSENNVSFSQSSDDFVLFISAWIAVSSNPFTKELQVLGALIAHLTIRLIFKGKLV